MAISRKDLLMPYEEFEKAHNIEQTRDDIPNSYLGTSPSKYYRTVDMNVKKLSKIVDSMFKKFSYKNPR